MHVQDAGLIFVADKVALDSRSCAFSSLVHLSDGTLVVAFRIATGRDSSDGRLRIMRSREQAETGIHFTMA
jgi:hypothetical protein